MEAIRPPADPAAELRAEVARQQIPIYRLAYLVNVHPSNLGQILRGRRPLTPAMAARIERALKGEEGGEHGRSAA